jgi:NAD(P)-dependent dehydrogenase (short-subunit alcohol dehydrogenase family)
MARLTTPFGRHTTANEVLQGIDLHGRRAIVTGGASGIGVETAAALARAGAHVTLAVRNVEAGTTVAQSIAQQTDNPDVQCRLLDLANLESIEAFGRDWNEPVHLLVNNAGVMALPETHTAQGWEMQFATNHLGHFALARGLLEQLTAAGNARIVSVSSSAHLMSPVIFDDLHFGFRPYDPWLAYGQAKTANVLFAVGATARWAKHGIMTNALMPGAIATNLQRHVGGMKTAPELRKTPAQGAATSVLLAASPRLEGISGRYFADCNEAEPVTQRTSDMNGVAPYALLAVNADRLWEVSEGLLR